MLRVELKHGRVAARLLPCICYFLPLERQIKKIKIYYVLFGGLEKTLRVMTGVLTRFELEAWDIAWE